MPCTGEPITVTVEVPDATGDDEVAVEAYGYVFASDGEGGMASPNAARVTVVDAAS